MTSDSANRPEQDVGFELNRTKRVIFIATPHRGSRLAAGVNLNEAEGLLRLNEVRPG